MKKYWQVYLNAIQDAFADRARLIVYILEDFIPPLVAILLWTGIYAYSGKIQSGWELNRLVSYYLLITFFSLALNHYIEFSIGEKDIQQGGLVKYLVKPVSYIKFVLIGSTGWKSVRLLLSVIPYTTLLLIFRKYWLIDTDVIPIFVSLAFAGVSYFMIYFYKYLLGISAFWTVENYGVVNLFWMIQTLFSGLLVPLDFLPDWLRVTSRLVPFRFFYYYPVAILMNRRLPETIGSDLLIALVWTLILGWASVWLFRKGLARLTDTR